MSDAFQVLLDAPGEPIKRIQIAKLGPVTDPRYGDFEITADNVASWQRNLSKLPGGEALIDFEHRSERKPRDSRAAGWITAVELDGDRVMADARWTPEGEQAIKTGAYRFMSPAYGPYVDDTGTVYDDTLCSAALTNKPALTMPALILASAERISDALEEDEAARFYLRALNGDLGEQVEALVLLDVSQAARDKAKSAGNSLPDGSYPINNTKQLKAAAILAASKHGNWQAAKRLIRRRAKELGVDVATLIGFEPKSADSRRTMDKAFLTALNLDEDTDLVTALADVELDETAERKLLDAAAALRTKADTEPVKPEPVKTLEQQAADANKRLLDADEFTKLLSQAQAGAAAAVELKEQRFETAFTRALEHPDGAKVTPAEKDTLHHFYTLDADRTLALIDARAPIVQAKPKGGPVIELSDTAEPSELVANGLHPDGHTLNKALHDHMREKGLPESAYPKLLDQYMSGQLVLQ